jgi:hypothetical protein
MTEGVKPAAGRTGWEWGATTAAFAQTIMARAIAAVAIVKVACLRMIRYVLVGHYVLQVLTGNTLRKGRSPSPPAE